MLRSTKGASKQRRDLINNEIGVLRDLLPLPESSRQRLSQLQVMSLACVFIRKCNYITRLFGGDVIGDDTSFSFTTAMAGFLLIVTKDGKMLYISDNVTEYLGHSMVDMLTQGDSLYDIIDKKDHSNVQAQLLKNPHNETEEVTFFCRMNVARSFRRHSTFGDHKVMHVRGHFVQPSTGDHYGSQPVFMALCTPLITPEVKESVIQNNTLIFRTIHSLDMKFVEIGLNGEYHLGYDDTELKNKSWYELLHPEDVAEAKDKHIQLIKSSHEMGCMLTVRLQTKAGTFLWLNMVMHIRQSSLSDNGEASIVCINQVIGDSEAQYFKQQSQMYSAQVARSPEHLMTCPSASPPHVFSPVLYDQNQQISLQLTAHNASSDCFTDYQRIPPPPYGLPARNPVLRGSTNSHEQDSDCSGSGSPVSPNLMEPTRGEVMSALKRRITDQSSCPPAKVPRFFVGDNNRDASASGSPTGFSLPLTYDILNGTVGCLYDVQQDGVAQLMQSYEKRQLSKMSALVDSADSVVPQTHGLTLTSVTSPLSPNLHDTDSQISIDCAVKLPLSILTPDPSPNYMESSNFFSRIDVDKLMEGVKNIKKEAPTVAIPCTMKPTVKQMNMATVARIKHEPKPLPILDPDSIDDYFDFGIPDIDIPMKGEADEAEGSESHEEEDALVAAVSPASSFADSLIDLATQSPAAVPCVKSPVSVDIKLEMWSENCLTGIEGVVPVSGTATCSYIGSPQAAVLSSSYGEGRPCDQAPQPSSLDL